MTFKYAGTKVHYSFSGKQNGPLIAMLHGWGANGKSFSCLEKLKKKFRLLLLDFPPFGKSDEPSGWNIFSYANMMISLLSHLGISSCHLLGHSFGGRVAILVSVIQPDLVNKVVLVDAAGMKPKRSAKYYINSLKYNVAKKLKKDLSKYGSEDYRKLSPSMKNTFASIVSTHLEEYAAKMKKQTLIIFGENDRETPIYMAHRLNKLINGSRLKIMENCSHFCFQDKPMEFCKLAIDFLEEKE